MLNFLYASAILYFFPYFFFVGYLFCRLILDLHEMSRDGVYASFNFTYKLSKHIQTLC